MKNVYAKYCDGIASVIRAALKPDSTMSKELNINIIKSVSSMKYDLHEEDGYLLSTTKTVFVEDIYGQKYKITVEEDNSDTDADAPQSDNRRYWC